MKHFTSKLFFRGLAYISFAQKETPFSACRTHYTPKDSEGIPTGEIVPVKDTAFDFTRSEIVGKRIGEVAGGYDHNYVLFGKGKDINKSTEISAGTSQ